MVKIEISSPTDTPFLRFISLSGASLHPGHFLLRSIHLPENIVFGWSFAPPHPHKHKHLSVRVILPSLMYPNQVGSILTSITNLLSYVCMYV